jgi:cobalt-zinc-cadmium efflux system outer membrane protein
MATAVLVAMLFTAEPSALTEDEAVATALARSRDVIAARLSVEGAQVDKAAAGILPNPVLSYTAANLVLGRGNPQTNVLPNGMVSTVNPGFFDQPVHSVGVSQVIDVWFKRSQRVEAADRGVEATQLLVDQAVREVSYAVRIAFADALRADEQRVLAKESRERYDETLRLTSAKLKVGDISDVDFKKIELEALRYKSAELQAALNSELGRQKLGALMVVPPTQIPQALAPTARTLEQTFQLDNLISQAKETRPDLVASGKQIERARAALNSQQREAYPDIALSLSYTHDNFTVSGDNPNSLAFGISLPIPLFDRNQGGVGHARVDLSNAENDHDKLLHIIEYDVADAYKRSASENLQLKLLTDDVAPRALKALTVAEKSYQAGAINLLELLEAQRTYVEVRSLEVDATYQFRQAVIDLTHAVGGTPK